MGKQRYVIFSKNQNSGNENLIYENSWDLFINVFVGKNGMENEVVLSPFRLIQYKLKTLIIL